MAPNALPSSGFVPMPAPAPLPVSFSVTYDHRGLHWHEPSPRVRQSSLLSSRSQRSKYAPHFGKKQNERWLNTSIF